jgi:hypothetical protein
MARPLTKSSDREEYGRSVKRSPWYHGQQLTGHRWLHARVDGGPDRRFRTNYQVPMYRPTFATLAGMNFEYWEDEVILLTQRGNVLVDFRSALFEWVETSVVRSLE